jgi:antirestriction protein ArdC
MNANQAVYARVTAKLVAALEAGTVPWMRDYHNAGLPRNAASGHSYSGINVWTLLWEGLLKEYSTSGWVTFKQAKEHGCVVRKDEKSTPVIFMSKVTPRRPKEGEDKVRPYFLAKMYSVFNLDQLKELEPGALAALRARVLKEFQHDPVAACDAAITATGAMITHKRGIMATPSYNWETDAVTMPVRSAFPSAMAYYATLFHELVHWTGHKTRLNRDFAGRFGTVDYGTEELVAELGAAFLAHRFGFDVISYSARYLQAWVRGIKANPSILVACASAASAAAEYLVPSAEPVAEPEAAA